jgi:hypothetical protein
VNSLIRKLFQIQALLMLGVICANAAGSLLDLSTWTVVQYELNDQPDAIWTLSNDNTVATQSVNADASILLGDFDIAGIKIEGTWRVNTSSDNDYMGFVFGYQSRSQFYLFDWKQADEPDPLGLAEEGMSVKLVNVSGNADPTGSDLWPSAGNSNVTVLRHNSIGWNDFTDYRFSLKFIPGSFEIKVFQDSDVLEHWVISDATYSSGFFGFYNYSQGEVIYSGFQDIPICACGDVDGNGSQDALTDGMLIMRYMFGFRGTALTQGAVAPDCRICTDTQIEACLDFLLAPNN